MIWLSELRVAIALFLLAAVIPLCWASIDSRRRLELKQTAYVACWSHQGRSIADCERLRPAELPESAAIVCGMVKTPAECRALQIGGK